MLNVLSDDRYDSSTAWLMEAISQVREELELLLRPVSGYTFTPELIEPCSVISAIRHIRKNGNTINPQDQSEIQILWSKNLKNHSDSPGRRDAELDFCLRITKICY